VSAFFLSGRFIRMVRMPSASVTITCSVVTALEPRLDEGAEASYGFCRRSALITLRPAHSCSRVAHEHGQRPFSVGFIEAKDV